MVDGSDMHEGDPGDPPGMAAVKAAIRAGDAGRVRALIERGADVRYKGEHGYDALIDASYSCGHAPDPRRLLDMLALLVRHGVDLAGVTTYNESALRVLSRIGRFDGIRLLLEAGADEGPLAWTPLIRAVALGTIEDVEAELARAPAALEARDSWSRTAFLTAVLAGDVAKATLLRERGADVGARGWCGAPALFHAIRGHHPEMVRWLLRGGADVHAVDELGGTALIEAVEHDDLACVEILLGAGADVQVDHNGRAVNHSTWRPMILRLLEAGADPADVRYAGQRDVLGLPAPEEVAPAGISAAEFRRTFTRRFGEANPERMDVPFWEAMVRSGASGYRARERFERRCGPLDEPVWSAQRFGQSLTLLPDGRAVQIGGEHEDHYDPDFCIYNDVFVFGPGGALAIYGCPEAVFAPTDFHTATLMGDSIYVIGSLGYAGTRRHGETPVYRLELRTMRFERVEVGGEGPGWIYRHRAEALAGGGIRAWGGTVMTLREGREAAAANRGVFVLDLERMTWRREGGG